MGRGVRQDELGAWRVTPSRLLHGRRIDPFKRAANSARRWLALAELCGEPRAVAASVGGLSIIISTGLSQFEFLQPIPIRDLRIPAHRGDAYVSNLIQTPTVLGHSI